MIYPLIFNADILWKPVWFLGIIWYHSSIFCFLLQVAGMFRDNSIGEIKVTYVVQPTYDHHQQRGISSSCKLLFMGASHSTIIFRFSEVSDIPRTNGTVHSGCTDTTQATARLVILHVSRIQKSCSGDNNFVNWKMTFRSDRPKWADWSNWTTFKAGPKYSGQIKRQFRLISNQNIRYFGLNGKPPMSTGVVLAWQKANILRHYHWFPREMPSEKQAQIFHTDDPSLTSSE